MKRIVVTLLVVLALGLAPTIPVYALTTADVTITATPEYLAITNSEAEWAIGLVAESHEYYWWTAAGTAPDPEPFEADDMKSIITNAGSIGADVDVKCANFTGGVGWTLSANETPGANAVSLRAGITGTANRTSMIQVTNGDIELVDNLTANTTKAWCMSLETGTFTDGVNKSGTVTLTISKP